MLGYGMILLAVVAALVSAYCYYQSATKKKALASSARLSFLVMVILVFGAGFLLMLYILRHQFEYAYVWSYSSRALPLELLITTFWAGQEGSFLLWALFSAIIGIILIRYSRAKKIEYEVMTVYSVLQAFLLLLLTVKSPFKFIWEEFPQQLSAGQIPADGQGLNPLLQNFWMIIHPPVLFLGFAATGVPFAFALGSLWSNRFQDWLGNAYPWVLFSAVALGSGLILGGYWAYGVLGWGGWWGWDPVENSSLVPWIVLVILLHTMVIQKKTGKLIRTNFALAILSFVLVVYSTFLTRSGVLGDASVHSFVDPGAIAYVLLILWILSVTVVGAGMLVLRWNALRALSSTVGVWTRESLLTLGSVAMGATALIILFGTSWPLVANSTFEPSFYDKTNLPFAIVMGLLLGLSLLVQWKLESLQGLVRRALVGLAGSVVVTALLVVIGVTDIGMILLAFASLFAFFVNVKRGIQLARENVRYLGGVLAHVGLAMLFLAVIGSGRYGEKVTVSLPLGEQKEVLGYELTYRGSQPTEDGKFKFVVDAERGESKFTLEPVMYQSTFNNSLMRNPDYVSFLTGDFYLEPVSVEEGETAGSEAQKVFKIQKGESITIGELSVAFVEFMMNQHESESMEAGGGFVVGAKLRVTHGETTEEITPVTVFKPDGTSSPKASMLKDGKTGFLLLNMSVDVESRQSAVQLQVIGQVSDNLRSEPDKTELLVAEASVKPFISFVWIAAVFVIGGLALAIYNTRVSNRG